RVAVRVAQRRQLPAPEALTRADSLSDLRRHPMGRSKRPVGARWRRATADRTRPESTRLLRAEGCAMDEPQHVGATFLADVFGSSTTCPVFICSLINGDAREGSAGAGERFVTTRTLEYIAAFARKWDIARRGVYWCVSTVARDARRRAKETLAELNCLHADIDFKDLDEDAETARRVLAGLRYPPSIVTASGNGLHPLWLFKEPVPAPPETIADVEQLLRRSTDLLGADPSAAECARLLRLPGTHNSKGGGWTEVAIETYHPALRYELDGLRDWLELAPQPLLHRRKSPRNGQSP